MRVVYNLKPRTFGCECSASRAEEGGGSFGASVVNCWIAQCCLFDWPRCARGHRLGCCSRRMPWNLQKWRFWILLGLRLPAPAKIAFLCAKLLTGPSAPRTRRLFGGDVTVAPLDAALINGTAAHALDFDDCSNTMGGHPSAPIVPALYALAEREKASGARLLEAYVTGFEVETKIGRAVNFTHYEKGWHPTSTLGTLLVQRLRARGCSVCR